MIAIDGFPDVDAVKDECYTMGKNSKLKGNTVVHVYLYLTAEIYKKIKEHIEEVEESEMQAEEASKNHCPSKRRKSDSPGKNLDFEDELSAYDNVSSRYR